MLLLARISHVCWFRHSWRHHSRSGIRGLIWERILEHTVQCTLVNHDLRVNIGLGLLAHGRRHRCLSRWLPHWTLLLRGRLAHILLSGPKLSKILIDRLSLLWFRLLGQLSGLDTLRQPQSLDSDLAVYIWDTDIQVPANV